MYYIIFLISITHCNDALKYGFNSRKNYKIQSNKNCQNIVFISATCTYTIKLA